MGVIAIRFNEQDEQEIKKKANINGKTVSEYCRDIILQWKYDDEQLNRATIESEIDALKKTVSRLNNNMIAIEKIIIGDTKEYSELILGFFNMAIDDEESKKQIYNEARAAKKEYVNRIFGDD